MAVGAAYGGYFGGLTRMVLVGGPSSRQVQKGKSELVTETQEEAIRSVDQASS